MSTIAQTKLTAFCGKYPALTPLVAFVQNMQTSEQVIGFINMMIRPTMATDEEKRAVENLEKAVRYEMQAGEILELQGKIDAKVAENSKLTRELADVTKDLEKSVADVTELRALNGVSNQTIETLKSRIEKLKPSPKPPTPAVSAAAASSGTKKPPTPAVSAAAAISGTKKPPTPAVSADPK
jgi:septal ring factor EnvC (AmiA/AmiB activator)